MALSLDRKRVVILAFLLSGGTVSGFYVPSSTPHPKLEGVPLGVPYQYHKAYSTYSRLTQYYNNMKYFLQSVVMQFTISSLITDILTPSFGVHDIKSLL